MLTAFRQLNKHRLLTLQSPLALRKKIIYFIKQALTRN